MADAHKNFAYSTVGTAPAPATSGLTLSVQNGDLPNFPAPPFNATVWPAAVGVATKANSEIVRVTAVNGAVFTILRQQEGSNPLAIQSGFQIEAGITAKTLTDAENGRTATLTVGFSNADYICTGSNDGAVLKAAYNAMVASGNGGKILIRNSAIPYNFSAGTDQVFIQNSNVSIEGETFGGVVFQATAAVVPGTGPPTRYGMVVIGQGTTAINGILFKNIIIDTNNIANCTGLTLDGGSGAALAGVIGLSRVTIENVICKNNNSGEANMYLIAGYTGSYGANKGLIDDVTFKNVEATASAGDGFWALGGGITNLYFDRCKFYGNIRNGFDFYSYPPQSQRCADWTFHRCRFYGNKITATGTSRGDFREDSQTGIDNLWFDDCYFGPAVNAVDSQDYTITPYSAANNRATNCVFDRTGNGISLGLSYSGQYNNIYPLNRFKLDNCIFYQCRSMFDPDSTIGMEMNDCIIWEVKTQTIFGPYSRHFPTKITDCLIYNAHDAETSATNSRNRSIFSVGYDGITIENVTMIDDRLIPNPVGGPSPSTVVGGALGARTYYLKHSWVNSQGAETMASNEVTLSIPANSLATINGFATTVPSGARKINIYVGTSPGAETLQTSIVSIGQGDVPITWTEPTTGLVAGTALPTSNTTAPMTTYGIYEGTGGQALNLAAARYSGNSFIGIPTPIQRYSGYAHIMSENYYWPAYTSQGGAYSIERGEYLLGNVTGTFTVDVNNGQNQMVILTGNTAFTLSPGDYNGQLLTFKPVQDATGGRTGTFTNLKKNGGSLTLSTGANAIDLINAMWNGTYWEELSRSLNIS